MHSHTRPQDNLLVPPSSHSLRSSPTKQIKSEIAARRPNSYFLPTPTYPTNLNTFIHAWSSQSARPLSSLPGLRSLSEDGSRRRLQSPSPTGCTVVRFESSGSFSILRRYFRLSFGALPIVTRSSSGSIEISRASFLNKGHVCIRSDGNDPAINPTAVSTLDHKVRWPVQTATRPESTVSRFSRWGRVYINSQAKSDSGVR